MSVPTGEETTGSSRPRARLVSLIGYRGTGKTTVARRLARRLGWEWADADEELERRAGSTIQEIFARGGEAAFRDWESATVELLSGREHVVVAWGGGVILRESNRAAIRRGWVVWLTADPETILARVQADPTTSQRRPNLTTGGGLQEIRQLLAAREPLYRECADWEIPTVDKAPDEVVGEIVCLLQSRLALLPSDHRGPDPS